MIRLAAAALAVTATAAPGPAGTVPAIAQFDSIYSSISDYSFQLRSHEVRGTQTQDRVYLYEFMKPHFGKVRILSGDGWGSVAVWTGGDQITVRTRGVFSFIHISVGLRDPRALSLAGYALTDGFLQHIIAAYRTTPGRLTQRPGGIVDGQPTDLLDLELDPQHFSGVSKSELYVSRRTHMPMRQIFWSGDRIVLDQSFSDIKFNIGLTLSDFTL